MKISKERLDDIESIKNAYGHLMATFTYSWIIRPWNIDITDDWEGLLQQLYAEEVGWV